MTVAAAAAGRRAGTRVADRAPAVALGLLVIPVLAANGGYYATSWGWTASALAGAALVAASVRDLSRPSLLELLFIGGFLAFAVWEALAMLWTEAPSETPLEIERTLVYVAAAIAVKTLVRRRRVTDLLGALLTGLVFVCTWALATRLFPSHFSQQTFGGGRLATPVGYWNGLGLVAAMAALLALGFAVRRGAITARTLAAAALPIALATLYFTFSRGAWLALGFGVIVLLAFGGRRLHLLSVAVPLAVVSGAALYRIGSSFGASSDAVQAAARAHGDTWAGVILVAALVSGNAMFVLRRLERSVKVRRRTQRAIGWAVVAAAVLVLVAAFAELGSPWTLARRGYDSISRPPPATHGNPNRRLLSLSSNGRLQQWRVSVRQFEAHPLGGGGPGSYEQEWAQHRPGNWKVSDAHSLYLETLGENGLIGLGLLALALVAPLVAFGRARREPLAAAALAAYAAYLAHAAVDWDWELSGLTLSALLCGGALLAWARPESRERGARRAAIALAAVVGLAALYGLAGNLAIAASGRDVATGNFERAATEARRAKLLAPWSARPWQLLGDAQLGLGQRAAAEASLEQAVAKSDRDWQLWLDLARARTGAARARAIATAQRLNPLDRTITTFGHNLAAKPRR